VKVLLVALGRMGNRYKDALERHFPDNLTLVTVDPKIPTGPARRHYARIEEVPEEIRFDLAIDARPNQDRLAMFEQFLRRDIPNLVIEKPHAASLLESSRMIAMLEAREHRPRILMPFYERYGRQYKPETLDRLDAGALKSLVVSAGAIGLGCNGIHYIDLANHLLRSKPVEVYAHLAPDSIPSPRGEQFRDHAGTLYVRYDNGGEFILTMRPDSSAGSNLTLLYEHGKIQVLEQIEMFWAWYRQPQETWADPTYRTHREARQEPPCVFEKDLIDQMIPEALNDLLSGHTVPDIYAGHNALRIIALAMASHLERRPVAWDEDRPLVSELSFQFT
jgi:predicted dehydrogenase